MRRFALMIGSTLGALALLPGCSTGVADDPGGAGGHGGAASVTAGSFVGTYEVPVPAELAGAALFPVAEIEWSVAGGVGTLQYDLPMGLVGKRVRVVFSGPVDAAATSATLTGPAGTADCIFATANVACREVMPGLTPLSPDYTVIEALAATEYAGPAADRLAVAQRFAGDPIGIVRVDLATPSTVDSGEIEKD